MLSAFLSDNSFGNKRIGAANLCVCVACFFTPLSTSLTGIFSVMAVLLWIISGHFFSVSSTFKRYPTTIFSLTLFALMVFAIFYSPADPSEGVMILKKYRELLLLPIIVSLFMTSGTYRVLAEHCFLAGCILLMLISFGITLDILPDDRYGNSIVFHITHNFFMAVLSFWALHNSLGFKNIAGFGWLFSCSLL